MSAPVPNISADAYSTSDESGLTFNVPALPSSQGYAEVRFFVRYDSANNEIVAAANSKTSHRLRRTVPDKDPTRNADLDALGAIEEYVDLCGPSGRDSRVRGRALIAMCSQGNYLSVTIRKKNPDDGAPIPIEQSTHIEGCRCSYEPNGHTEKSRLKFLFSIANQSEVIYDAIGTQSPEPGVYVIAGGTGTGKSSVVRGIIYHFLRYRLDNTRTDELRPHFLTIENPIETMLYRRDDVDMQPDEVQSSFGVDYTPRQIPDDTPNLEQALLRDALRQTPFLTYVGEARTEKEMRHVLEFAGTGHPVITTMHAGSVREAMERMLDAAKATTWAMRGQVARRIRAIVHLDMLQHGNRDWPLVTLPAIWLGRPEAIAALIANGYSSVLPNRYTDRPQGRAPYTMGRAHFLWQLWHSSVDGISNRGAGKIPAELTTLQELAIGMDTGIPAIPNRPAPEIPAEQPSSKPAIVRTALAGAEPPADIIPAA